MKRFISSNFLILVFSIVITLPVILPYFHKGFFPTHDGEWAVVRLSEMFRELKDLQFPPRYSGYLNFGYGYPLFNFTYPMPYYIGIILHFLKFNFVDSIKVLFAVSVPLSSLFMYLASKELWKSKLAAVVSSIFYIYLPYRFVDLFVRGSLGESLSFALFPLIFYCIIKISNNSSSKYLVLLGGISYAILIMTHNIMAVFFSIIFVFFLVFQLVSNKKSSFLKLFLILIFGFGLSSFFWIPAIIEKGNILLSQVPIADRSLYFVKPAQFMFPSWGYGTPTEKDGFSYQLGWPLLLVFVLSIAIVFFKDRKQNLLAKNALFLILSSLFFIFFLFSPSRILWNLPLLSEINYPFTMLLPIGFLSSLLAGFLCSKKGIIKFVPSIFVIISVVISIPYAKPQYYVDRGEGFYFTNDATTTSSKELMPLWVKKMPIQRPVDKVQIIKGEGKINNLVFNSKKIEFNSSSQKNSLIRISTIYYPGWKASVNNKPVRVLFDNEQGVVEINVPKGQNSIKLSFSETPLRLFADVVSIISFSVIVVWFLGSLILKSYFKKAFGKPLNFSV